MKQEYDLTSYADGTPQTKRVTTAANPESLYDLRFYRDSQGKPKFRLKVFTYGGMASSIEDSAKQLTVSGKVTKSPSGGWRLDITSRRDAMSSVGVDVEGFDAWGLSCDNDRADDQVEELTVANLPVIVLEKASEEKVNLATDLWNVPVTPKVRWKMKGFTKARFFPSAG